MALLEWLTKRKQPLSRMTRSELRRQELLLDKDRTQLLNKITKIATDKHTLFERGSQEKTPEVRRMLAQEFEPGVKSTRRRKHKNSYELRITKQPTKQTRV